jgi:uncharacterized membrane protein YphA (DoxX/SURF4 family)
VRRIARLVVAGVFLYAGAMKIADPPGFAHEVFNYKLLPPGAVNVVALWLPWIEVVSGVALLAGFRRKAAAGILGALLLAFLFGLSVNLARGRPVDCGCFGGAKAPRTDAERLAEMRLAIGRDLLLLLLLVPAATRKPAVEPARSGGLSPAREREPS